ncbi:MAG TPA: DUF4097 family beta strand repeat-containing protein [Candidatus Angelobacter sp.]
MINLRTYTKIHSILKLAAVLALLMSGACGWADANGDRVAYKLEDSSRPASVRAHLLNGGITVKGSAGNEVIVEARVRGGADHADNEGRLKRIPQTATGLSVDAENNEVVVKVDALQRTVDVTITVPRRTSLSLHTVNDGDIVVSDVEGEMDINDVNGSVTLRGIGGSVVAHALNGKVLVTFTRVDPQKSMAFSSLNGDIDVTFPPDIKANLSLRSDNGEIYSDFDIQMQATAPQPIVDDERTKGGHYRVRMDKTIRATINGGGPEFQFKNFNGNIYIRKAGTVK